jgi:hypothetical protein
MARLRSMVLGILASAFWINDDHVDTLETLSGHFDVLAGV